MSKQKSKAALYLEMKQSREIETIEVTCPSGMVFTFQKPKKYSILFEFGQLPQTVSSTASADWTEQGLIKAVEGSDETKNKVATRAFEMAQDILKLSVDPKIVAKEAMAENELSVKDILDSDLEYLFKWMNAGGDEAVMASMFPERQRQRSVAVADGAKLRAKAKRNSRHKK